MKKKVLRVSVALVCVGVVALCLRFQSCSNIAGMGGQSIPAGYGRITIASNQRATSIDNDEIKQMELRYKMNGVDVTHGYMDFVVGASVRIVVDGYVNGKHRLHHEEPPIVVHAGENIIHITLSKSKDAVGEPEHDMDIGVGWAGDPQPVLGQYGETVETSHFEHVKDVQWGSSNTSSFSVSSPEYCYNAKTGKQTLADMWTEGSYVHLTKNADTTREGSSYLQNPGKDVPTFTETLYTKTDSGYTQTVLADDVIVLGISRYGMMTVAKNSSGSYHYGAFVYTSEGWEESGKGTATLTGEWQIYPMEEEIAAALASFRN